jgi:lipoprotein signal peptidase
VFLLGSMAFLADWASKGWAQSALAEGSVEVGRITLAFIENDALAFSLGYGLVPVDAIFLARMILFALCALLALLGERMPTLARAGFVLMAAGALGNLADLGLRGGAVVDFIGVDPVSLVTGRETFHLFFNVADVWILLGCALALPVLRRVGLAVQARFRAWEERLLGTAGTHPHG